MPPPRLDRVDRTVFFVLHGEYVVLVLLKSEADMTQKQRRTRSFTFTIHPGKLKRVVTFPAAGLRSTTIRGMKYVNITPIVEEAVRDLKIREGAVYVQIHHTTAAVDKLDARSWLKVQENERGLAARDLPKVFRALTAKLQEMVPTDFVYEHDREERIRALSRVRPEPVNGEAHLLSSFFSTAVSANIIGGRLVLGPWQRILLYDFDPKTHPGRQISVVISRRR